MSDEGAPWLWLIAGPNGSGKSTLASEFMPDIAGTSIFLNADEEARSMNQADPASVAICAGRRVLLRISAQIEAKESFAIETTLSGLSHI